MNTVFSLVYFECCKRTPDLLNVTNGPFLFGSKESAEEKLLGYVRNRIAEAYADALAEDAAAWDINLFDYTDYSDKPLTSEEAYALLLGEKNKLSFDGLVNWFSNMVNDEDVYFGYKIEELPTSSFLEELNKADAIEIDGHFIRHFHLTPDEELEDEDNILLDVSTFDDDLVKFEYYVSVTEAETASFNPKLNSWKVGELDVTLIKFSNT